MKTFVDPHMKRDMGECLLEEFPAGDRIRAFYLKRPNQGRMGSVMLLFTPEGIIIEEDEVLELAHTQRHDGYGVGADHPRDHSHRNGGFT